MNAINLRGLLDAWEVAANLPGYWVCTECAAVSVLRMQFPDCECVHWLIPQCRAEKITCSPGHVEQVKQSIAHMRAAIDMGTEEAK